MMDNGSHVRWDRDRHVDAYAHLNAGIESGRMLRAIAWLGIASRLFYIYASANRISVTHTLLGLFEHGRVDANGQLDLSGQADRGLGLVSQAHDADALVTVSVVVSVIVLILFVLALVSVSRRRKRGDAVATAIDQNPAVRLAGRCYLVIAIVAIIARNALNPGTDAPPEDRLHALMEGDTATIALQIGVIGILLLIALATGREVRRARAAGLVG